MNKRILAMALTGAMTVGMLAGCGGDKAPTGSGAGASGGDKNVGVILKTTSSEYWQYVKAGAEAYGKEMGEKMGVKVEVKGATSETAYDEQQNMIETDLNSGAYDALVIAPLQADLVKTLVAGTETPIIAVDTKIDAPEVLSFVGTGNVNAGAVGGKAAVEAAKAAGWKEVKCIEICGVQGDSTNEDRKEGYAKGVNEAGGEFLMDETQYADAVADKAVNCMEAIMQSHPEGIAIICANNDDMAMGAARAAKGHEAYKNTIFMGFDGNMSACEAIKAGNLTMSVIQDAYGMGYKAVEAAVKVLNGEKIEKFIDSGTGVVDASNVDDRIATLNGYLGK